MNLSRIHKVEIVFLTSLLVFASCKGKPPANPPTPVTTNTAPTPPPPAPVITLRAQPAAVDRGSSTTLTWEARNAASVTITPGLGDVPVTGNRSVTPTSSVTYQATATGPGGSASDIARVTVNIPAAPAADESPRTPTVTGSNLAGFDQGVKDVFFEYDKAEIRSEMVNVLMSNATWLKANSNVRINIEGHCDERGSEEYNLGLGDRRANAVKEFLLNQGIAASRMSTVSYGEERPVCREQTEACYEKNRRAHFEQAR
jgi:peptidoglycan-associated lipoprotein